MQKWLLSAIASLGVMAAALVAHGADIEAAMEPAPVTEPVDSQDATAEQPHESEPANLLSIDGGVDFATAYFFRGYNIQDQGLISQPYVNLTLNVPQLQDIGGSGVGVSPFVGTWNSIHTKGVAWYESDLLAGVNITKGPFTCTVQYTYYSYPGGAATTSQEISAQLAFDDSPIWQKVAPKLPGFVLSPHILIARDLDRSAVFANTGPQTYVEVGLEPSIDVEIGKIRATISAPMVLGMTLDHYYTDESGSTATVGYGSVGAKLSIPLPLDEKYGTWRITAGATYVHDYADSARDANDGHADKVIGVVGIGFSR